MYKTLLKNEKNTSRLFLFIFIYSFSKKGNVFNSSRPPPRRLLASSFSTTSSSAVHSLGFSGPQQNDSPKPRPFVIVTIENGCSIWHHGPIQPVFLQTKRTNQNDAQSFLSPLQPMLHGPPDTRLSLDLKNTRSKTIVRN